MTLIELGHLKKGSSMKLLSVLFLSLLVGQTALADVQTPGQFFQTNAGRGQGSFTAEMYLEDGTKAKDEISNVEIIIAGPKAGSSGAIVAGLIYRYSGELAGGDLYKLNEAGQILSVYGDEDVKIKVQYATDTRLALAVNRIVTGQPKVSILTLDFESDEILRLKEIEYSGSRVSSVTTGKFTWKRN
jgi:hypothetical protein